MVSIFKPSLLLLVVALIIFSTSVSAVCTLTLDDVNYTQLATATVTASCSSANERNNAYTMNWTNETGFQLQADLGTTPLTSNINFFEAFIIPSNYLAVYGGTLNVTMTGNNLEGDASAFVNSGSPSTLIITNGTLSPDILLGRVAAFKFNLIDENLKGVNGAHCFASIEDGNGFPVATVLDTIITSSGRGIFSTSFGADDFEEDRSYVGVIECNCGITGTNDECFDEDGVAVASSFGAADIIFTIGSWLTVETIVNLPVVVVGDTLSICANVTSPGNRTRQQLLVHYNYRCDSANAQNTNRIIFGEFTEFRGIDSNTSQMQCHSLTIPENILVEQGANRCHAATDVQALNDLGQELVMYSTLSTEFNISVHEIHPRTIWERASRTKYTTNVSFNAYSVGVRDIDVIVNPHLFSFQSEATGILNFTVTYFNGTAIPYATTISVETERIKQDVEFEVINTVSVEIKGVDTNLHENFNVTVEFVDFDSRSALALEEIANKTGTFHFDLGCNAEANRGDDLACNITAQIEDTQTVQKEVDFTCFINGPFGRVSELNFNQMVNQTEIVIPIGLKIVPELVLGAQYTAECNAGYYNLGSRVDTFSTSFQVRPSIFSSTVVNILNIIKIIFVVAVLIATFGFIFGRTRYELLGSSKFVAIFSVVMIGIAVLISIVDFIVLRSPT